MNAAKEKQGAWSLLGLIAAFLVFSAGHLAVTPVSRTESRNYINAPDEAAHLKYIEALGERGHIPIRGDRESPTYEWHQPPGYYLLAAPLYTLGPRAVRWLGIVIGTASIFVVYIFCRRVFPEDYGLAWTAAGIASLVPMRQATSASAGNDPLLELLFSGTMLLLARAVLSGFSVRTAAGCGLMIGLATYVKANSILLFPLVVIFVFLVSRTPERRRAALRFGGVALGAALVLSAPWWVRNHQLYGEMTPMRSFLREFEGTQKASDWIGKQPLRADLWTGSLVPGDLMTRTGYLALVGNWSFRTFWAAYTPERLAAAGVPLFLPPPLYALFAGLALVAICGLGVAHHRSGTEMTAAQRTMMQTSIALLVLTATAFAGFTWTFFQAQGRYLYPALLPISLLIALGIRSVAPPPRRDAVSAFLLLVLGACCFVFLVGTTFPAYSAR